MIDDASGVAGSVSRNRPVLDLDEIDPTQVELVGGKGAQLAELARLEGTGVPTGFCVTTSAFERVVAEAPALDNLLERLFSGAAEQSEVRALSREIRGLIEEGAMPGDLADAITQRLTCVGADTAYAVRSSATAEDLPTASFAGQHDTYLNVAPTDVVEHIVKCWASLFTDRAVAYRLHNRIDHRSVRMAVVIQTMVCSDAAGVLFTADPITSNRRITTIEAVLGLGESLVSGSVNADSFAVRDDAIVDKSLASDRRSSLTLTDAQAVQLARLGRRIEAHFGCPQDIEWCLADDAFHIVQSRPITTLFPIPAAADDQNRVYLSVGHQQMMSDAMRPLGLSVWHLTTPRPMTEAGGRLFVDVTETLGSPARDGLLETMRKSDPLMRDALQTVLDRDFVSSAPPEATPEPTLDDVPTSIEADPTIVTELIDQCQASLAVVRRDIASKSGPELFDFILADLHELRRILFDPQSSRAVMAAIESTWCLNEQMHTWLGETNASDVLTQSVDNNITSQMGLALLDVADAIRPHPEVVAYLRTVRGDEFLDGLDSLAGGREARTAIESYLDTYGMRCIGEIDITRPRWSEQPGALVPLILNHIDNFEAGASTRHFEAGLREAQAKEQELLERLRSLPDGDRKVDQTKEVIERLRTFIGYREYPKYGMISRYLIYKQALVKEAVRLVGAGVLRDVDDIFYLRFEELHEVVRAGWADHGLIRERREAFQSYRSLTPPRVLTSEGEAIAGTYRRDDVPEGALAGIPVCAGDVEGRARVVTDMADADLQPGDILVTAYTDPSWSPAFVTIGALVTEVGGLMTHGAVVAREYGLPAVVGVADATKLVRDGQRIRVDGTSGYVEILG